MSVASYSVTFSSSGWVLQNHKRNKLKPVTMINLHIQSAQGCLLSRNSLQEMFNTVRTNHTSDCGVPHSSRDLKQLRPFGSVISPPGYHLVSTKTCFWTGWVLGTRSQPSCFCMQWSSSKSRGFTHFSGTLVHTGGVKFFHSFSLGRVPLEFKPHQIQLRCCTSWKARNNSYCRLEPAAITWLNIYCTTSPYYNYNRTKTKGELCVRTFTFMIPVTITKSACCSIPIKRARILQSHEAAQRARCGIIFLSGTTVDGWLADHCNACFWIPSRKQGQVQDE